MRFSKLLAGLALGVYWFSFSAHVDAARIHDRVASPRKNTVRLSEPILDDKGDIRDRIKAIILEKQKKNDRQDGLRPELDDVRVPVNMRNESILGAPMATQQQCLTHLLRKNPHPAISVSPAALVSYYYEEGEREGVRPDVAFAQALHETGYFGYGGTVVPEQNNYCGLGTTSSRVRGTYFPSAKMGVRAHIQHLMAYASTRKPTEPIVDPRYGLVRTLYGNRTLGTWRELNGRWAVPGRYYGQRIMEVFGQILSES